LDAFVARAVLAQSADRSIDAQYYLLHDDMAGALFVDQLLRAADRGVRVRLLVDDMDLAGRDLGAAALDAHPNMEVRLFNPFSRKSGRGLQLLTRFGDVTRRMHNKSFTVDNQISILGGRNIGNEYFDADPDLQFADLDVMVIGPLVHEVSSSFDRYWNSELAYPASSLVDAQPTTAEHIEARRGAFQQRLESYLESPYLQSLRESDLSDQMRRGTVEFQWGRGEVVADAPEKILEDRDQVQYHMAPSLKPYFQGAQEELIIFSPYFVPGKKGTAFFQDLSERGVRVRILTNSLASTDVSVVHAGYAKYRKALLRSGVELYEVDKQLSKAQRKEKRGPHGSSKASLHAKTFVFDRRRVFIGSLNLDPRSVTENTEIGVVLESDELGRGMGEFFDQNIDRIAFRLELTQDEDGRERILWHRTEGEEPGVYEVDPHTGFWRRVGIALMGLLPVESQL
jgi:putative cardiolipin synthase